MEKLSKSIKFILLMILISSSLFAQKIVKLPNGQKTIILPKNGRFKDFTPEMDSIEKANEQCVHRDLFTASQRSKIFPFNKAKKIVLVSFNYMEPNPEIIYNKIEPSEDIQIDDSLHVNEIWKKDSLKEEKKFVMDFPFHGDVSSPKTSTV